MFQFEIDVRSGSESERFNTTVYRFLELHAEGVDDMDLVKIQSCPTGSIEHKTLTLWSPESISEFERFWAKARLSR